MLYSSASEWRQAPHKRILLFATSGLGKTWLSQSLRATGDWFHYSIDYRIGTRYLGESITTNAKREAMKVPFLREMLMSDSIYIASNITFENLAPVSAYLGKPGNTEKGGLPFSEYTIRQAQFRAAEEAALLDTKHFIDLSQDLYGYPHFVCDTGGSICEWVDPNDPNDPILKALSKDTLMVWIKGSEEHTSELIRRFDRAPKPMSYQTEFLENAWTRYLAENDYSEGQVDPDAFVRWTYAQALAHRQPRYEAMAKNWGVTIEAEDIANLQDPAAVEDVIARAIETR